MKNKEYQVLFFPKGIMEDYLSEKIVFISAQNEKEAENKAVQKIELEKNIVMNYKLDKPLILKR